MLCMHGGTMRDLARISALLGVFLSAACGGDDGPPDLGPAAERGDVVITWSLFNAMGDEITCTSLGATDAYVAVGGEPKIITCGDEQRVVFEDLLPQRYPVVIRIRGLANTTIPQGERFDNVNVVGNESLDYHHDFNFDEGSDNQGSVRMTWEVDSQPATTGCDTAGAATVHAETTGGAVAQFMFDAPCVDGEFLQSGLRPGNYEVRMDLRDDAGATLAARSATFRVLRASTAQAGVSFNSGMRPVSDLFATWTITSSRTPPCQADWTVRLLLQEDQMNPITTATATTSCAAGEYRFEDLISPQNPIASRYKLTLTLLEPLRGELDRDFVDDLQLIPSMTTTVTMALTPP